MKKVISLALLALFYLCPAFAQGPVNVAVSAVTEDMVGKSFVYDLKELIGHSATYRLVDESDTKNTTVLRIVSLSVDESGQNNSSAAISVVLTLKGDGVEYFFDQWSVLVGSQSTQSMARKILASVDHDLDELRKVLNKR
jgi:hypothetical protein